MEGILENEQYTIKTKCPQCQMTYNEKKLGAFIHQANMHCPDCKVKTEVESVEPTRQILHG